MTSDLVWLGRLPWGSRRPTDCEGTGYAPGHHPGATACQLACRFGTCLSAGPPGSAGVSTLVGTLRDPRAHGAARLGRRFDRHYLVVYSARTALCPALAGWRGLPAPRVFVAVCGPCWPRMDETRRLGQLRAIEDCEVSPPLPALRGPARASRPSPPAHRNPAPLRCTPRLRLAARSRRRRGGAPRRALAGCRGRRRGAVAACPVGAAAAAARRPRPSGAGPGLALRLPPNLSRPFAGRQGRAAPAALHANRARRRRPRSAGGRRCGAGRPHGLRTPCARRRFPAPFSSAPPPKGCSAASEPRHKAPPCAAGATCTGATNDERASLGAPAHRAGERPHACLVT